MIGFLPEGGGTASYSGDTNVTSAISAALTQTVSQGGTTVGLVSSSNPAPFGRPVTFTAAVSAAAPAIGTPTGVVTLMDGTTTPATTLGTEPLSKGAAVFSTSILSVGSHKITASYAGDTNFTGANSAVLSQAVLNIASVALSTSQSPVGVGQAITFTATVSPEAAGTGTPTGTVNFLAGTVLLGTGSLVNGTASISSFPETPGSYAITASYSGDNSFAGATSKALNQVVLGAASVTLTSSESPAAVGHTITFAATVSAAPPATGTPTGTVTFLDGTTSLGTETLLNGVAAFSTSSLSSGSHAITASYSGDSVFGSAQATLSQIVWNAWLPVDISVGADDLTRVLWTYPDGRGLLWSLDRTSGNYTQGPVFGPYDGGVWHATRIACGKDGMSHILWNRADGALSLWWANANNTFRNSMSYGPFAGWSATDISVDSDNLTRILWTNTDGQALVWSVNPTTGNYTSGPAYGPYNGYTAVALACGSDGLTRLVWANPAGIASLWIMNAANQEQSSTIFGPYAGWIPTDINVGSDNLARLLWTNTVNGNAIVWSVDATGNASNNLSGYGPYPGYTAQRVACGSDGFTRLTWVSTGGILSFWHMAPNNTMLTFNIYGPYF